MSLSNQQRKFLKSLAHPMKPVVMVGDKGLSENVLAEIELALGHHELIKVKVAVGDREDRDAAIQEICDSSQAELITRIGHVAVLYRERPANFKAGKRTQLYSIKLPKA